MTVIEKLQFVRFLLQCAHSICTSFPLATLLDGLALFYVACTISVSDVVESLLLVFEMF
jgi:hypothetical protein